MDVLVSRSSASTAATVRATVHQLAETLTAFGAWTGELIIESYRRIPVLSVSPGKRSKRTSDICPWLDGEISNSRVNGAGNIVQNLPGITIHDSPYGVVTRCEVMNIAHR